MIRYLTHMDLIAKGMMLALFTGTVLWVGCDIIKGDIRAFKNRRR